MKSKYVRADLHSHVRTTNRFKEEDFNKIVDAVHKNMGGSGIIGLVNVGIQSAWNYERIIGFRGYERKNLGNAVYVFEKDVLIVKTQQVPTKQGHYLVVGIPEGKKLEQYRTLEDSLKEAKDLNAIVLTWPMFRFQGIGAFLQKHQNLLTEFDGITIHNGQSETYLPFLTPRDSNKQAQEFYDCVKKEYPLLAQIVVSDGHSFGEIGSSWMEIPRPDIKTDQTLISSLKENLKNPIRFKKGKSHFGALKHTAKLFLITVLNKRGIEVDDKKYLEFPKGK